MINFLIQAAIMIAIMVLSYVLAPKPKKPKPAELKDLENPTAEAGRPIKKFWGTLTINDPNILWFGDKSMRDYEVNA
jgi:hypothetical protein